MAERYLMLDVGGTGIKAGILDQKGNLIGDIISFDARAKEEKEVIFTNFVSIIEQMGKCFSESHDIFNGIGMAFPGPFDYEHGISLIKGLDKYDHIYGCSIKEEIMKWVKSGQLTVIGDDCPFLFLHDVEAFGLGESVFGQGAKCKKLMCLCIGTGAGSAFLEDGHVLKHRCDIPDEGWIYSASFKDGIIDDYISVRGLRSLAEQRISKPYDGEALYHLAVAGDCGAKKVFTQFGSNLLEAIYPFLQNFDPDGLILGGKIAYSYSFFGGELDKYCHRAGIEVYQTADTSKRAMEGLFVKFMRNEV